MKYRSFIVLLWLFFTVVDSIHCQNSIDLNFRIIGSTEESRAAIFKKLRIDNPLTVKFSGLDAKIGQIIGYYENSGYPFVQVRLDSVSPVTDGISGILVVNPGETVMVDTLLNRTGFRISTSVLGRLMNIRPGDLYRESSINEASRRLGQIPYLSQTRPLEVGFHPGKASVYVYPEKSGANRFDGWIGLSPDFRSGGKLTFSGALILNLNNVLAQGEYWQFDWHRNQDASQKLDIAMHFPYLAGLPVGLLGKFELYRQDTTYLNVGWDLGIPYHFSPDHLINLFIRQKESSILVPAKDLENSGKQPFASFLSGLLWEYNHLDSRINPYHGFTFRLEAVTGRKNLPDSISMKQSEFMADVSWFQPLAKSLTCGIILHSGYRKSPVTYENEQYRLGGLNLLRGFDEDVFRSNAYAVGSLELRYLLDRTSHLIVLADIGILKTLENDNPVIKTPAGIGLGGQLRTSGGIFRIIFAVGKESNQPFGFKNSKIHLGYVGVF